MNQAIADLGDMLRTLEPELHDGVYVYSTVPPDTDLSTVPALATFREAEGVTLILKEEEALQRHFPLHFRAAWITLRVHSALEAVGLTAAFAQALAEAGIGCNVVAAAYHDHIFVPVERAPEAMAALRALQERATF
jgi:hypothetical protein